MTAPSPETGGRRRSAAPRALTVLAVVAMMIMTGLPPAVAAPSAAHPQERLFADPFGDKVQAALQLGGQQRRDALRLAAVPTATWFTGASPAETRRRAAALTFRARVSGATPVIVAYDIPFRDCALYSAGGATSTAEYEQWVDALAAGIADRRAIVVIEPDGLGVVPFNTDLNGAPEGCQPAGADAATAADERYAQLRYAVQTIAALPNTRVYLDATNPGWLSVGEVASRLRRAGVDQADGFAVNVSNYYDDQRNDYYARWVSDCLRLTDRSDFGYTSCASQYYPADPNDVRTWGETSAAYDAAFAATGVTRDPSHQAHAVIDTSRNGQGTWTPAPGRYTDAEAWCNPPGRGVGARPSTSVDDPYVDARLWIKVPGDSDGQCYRGTGGPEDPERMMVDPDAGQWFPQMARELVANADPDLGP